jgi:hypothetical protein
MGEARLVARVAIALTMSVSLALVNVLFSPRDQFLTVGISSFEPDQIISERLWVEGPVQVLNTFMGPRVSFVGVGVPGRGGLPFADRLKLAFGAESVNQSETPVDLREILSDEDLGILERFVQNFSYRSSMPCPHDAAESCVIAVGWNRERTKAPDMVMISTRIAEDTYLILDDSLLSLGNQ